MQAVLLIGHGGVPQDFPRAELQRLKSLEQRRRASGAAVSDEEARLDRRIRTWPRSQATDPYQAGTEAIAERLRARLAPRHVGVAYNEFCAPSVEDAVAELVRAGARELTLITTMPTPGGVHAEIEIPELVAELIQRHPEVRIRYAWPFDLDAVAALLAEQVRAFGG